MKTIIWDKPVSAGGTLVFGPLEAHKHLMGGWTSVKDRTFAAAANGILDALEGRASPDFARELFEEALLSARGLRLA